MAILNVLNGYKTYIAAAGMLGLGVFQLSTGQFGPAVQTLLSALATASLRHAVGGHKS